MLLILKMCFLFPAVKCYDFVGCFSKGVQLSYSFANLPNSGDNTIECMDFCKIRNYGMIASTLQATVFECYCGNDNQLPTQIDVDDCSYPCPVSTNDQCGGETTVAVYSIATHTGPFNVLPISKDTTTTLTGNTDVLFQTTEDYETGTSTVASVTKDYETGTSTVASVTEDYETGTSTVASVTEDYETGTSTVASDVTSIKNVNNGNNTCVCDNSTANKYSKDLPSNNHPENITTTVEKLRAILAIDVKSTSKYINSKRSIPDDRPSAIAMGTFGIIAIFVPMFLVFLSDGIKLITSKSFKKCFAKILHGS